ncbi:MAG: MOSC domain-containing protein [Actinomycetota bacterium]
MVGLQRSTEHSFHKFGESELELIAGIGVSGDAHAGARVRHRSRVAADPTQPNLRQVHLIHAELFELLADRGFTVSAGDMGENITTSGIDLLGLPVGATLAIGEDTILSVTGLRNPCRQLNDFQDGLTGAVLDRAEDGSLIRLAGVMAVVVRSGVIALGDNISVALPPVPHHPLERV